MNALHPPCQASVSHRYSRRRTHGRAFQPLRPHVCAEPRGCSLMGGCVGALRTSIPSVLLWDTIQGLQGRSPRKNQGGTHVVAWNVWGPASRHRDRCQTGVGRGQEMLWYPSQGPMGVTYPSQQHTSCLTHSDRRHRWFSPMEAMVSCFSEALIFVSQGPTQKKSNRSQ